MNDTLFHVGDEFVGNKSRTWGSLKITSVLPRSAYCEQKYRCSTTAHNGRPGPPVVLYESTVMRYTKREKQDFNRNTESYPRPMGPSGFPLIDLPDSATALIRDDVTVPKYIGRNTSTLIHVGQLATIRQAKSRKAKAQLLLSATDGYMMLAVPGTYSMDIFYVDNRDDALKALGFTTVETPKETFTDASGKVWVAA